VTAKDVLTLFALFAQIERYYYLLGFVSLFFLRTKEALAAKKAQRVVLGKPKGTFRVSIFDKDREHIQRLFLFGVPQKQIVERHLEYDTTKSLRYYTGRANFASK